MGLYYIQWNIIGSNEPRYIWRQKMADKRREARKKNEEKQIVEVQGSIDDAYVCMVAEGAQPKALVKAHDGYQNFTFVDAKYFAEDEYFGRRVVVDLIGDNGADISVWMNFDRIDGGSDKATADNVANLLATFGHPWGPGNGHFLTDTVEVDGKRRNINFGKKFYGRLEIAKNSESGKTYLKLWEIKTEVVGGGACAGVVKMSEAQHRMTRAERKALRAERNAS